MAKMKVYMITKEQQLTLRQLAVGIIIGLIACAMITLCVGCKTTEYVPVTQQHTEHHWHTDSIYKTDSVIKEKETVVMQLDSAAMAKYGIQLKSAERAWLVKTQEMERIIQELMAKSEQKDTVHDSIPYPVKEIVIQEPAWVIKGRKYLANFVICLIAIVVIIYTGKRFFRL